MRTLLSLLLFGGALSAQSQPVPCGPPAAGAASPAPAGRSVPVAAKIVDGQPAEPRADAGGAAAQIRLRRPPVVSATFPCWCGTVAASALTAQANSQEVPILTGLAGTFRLEHVLLQETTRFASDSADSLAVGVGRANLGADVVAPFSLKSASAPYNSWYERPTPPQLTGAYDLVLNFKSSGPLGDGTASHFGAGAVAWEVCGYTSIPSAAR